MFPGRSKKIVGRSDLANPNRAANMGVNYRLLECCFISNTNDRNRFINQMDDVARGILAAFGISSTPSKPTTPPSSGFKPYVAKVTASVLNIRKGAGTNYAIAGAVKKNEAYTIVEERSGKGFSRG